MDRFTKSPDALPFFVSAGSSAKKGLNLLRWWRSLPRLQRSVATAALLLLFVTVCLAVFSFKFTDIRVVKTDIMKVDAVDERDLKIPPANDVVDRPPWQPKEEVAASDPHKAAEGADLKPEAGQQEQLMKPKFPKFTGPENDKQRAVVGAFKHAWAGYKKYAWGKDQLRPISKSFQEWFGTGLTIVDSLDTMLILGLNEEFAESKAWVEKELSFDKNTFVSLFETTIRMLGGLLSAYHLSGERVFLDKATDLGTRLIGAFDAPSPVPYSDVNLQSKKGKQPSWGGDSSLSEITSIQLEFRDLSRLTGDPVYERLSFNVSQHLHKIGCEDHDGLCPMFISPQTGQWKHGAGAITFGARSDSYYEYLLKQWLQTGKTIDWLHDDYKKAMASMQNKLLRYSEPNKLTFVGELLQEKTFSPKMDHLVCYLSGTLALGAHNGLPQEHMDVAKQLGHTCNQMYENPTGLGPEIAHFNMLPGQANDLYIKPLDAHSLLRPEAIEAWFYLYRLTGDKQYVEWGWKAFQAIEKYAKVTNGYSSVNNVKKIPVSYRDLMESFYLAETLKYLYLLFADDQNIIPLDEYVFNTEAHPLPVYQN